MAAPVTTQTDYDQSGLAHVWTLYDDGTVTITDGKGGTVDVAATPDTTAQAASIVASRTTEANQATIQAALTALVAANSSARTAMTTNATFLAIASPSNAQVAAQVKALTNQNQVIIPRLLQLARLSIGALDAAT